MPFWAIPGVAAAATAGIGGLAGAGIQAGANAALAKANRDWQERMSNTAYQRAVKDMRAAGVNPMLVAKLGGASTPPGAAGAISQPGFAKDLASAAEASQRRKEKDRLDATIRTLNAQETRELANAGNLRAQEALALQNATNAKQVLLTEIERTRSEAAQADAVTLENARRAIDNEFYSSALGKWTRTAERAAEGIAPWLAGGLSGWYLGRRRGGVAPPPNSNARDLQNAVDAMRRNRNQGRVPFRRR